MNIFPQGLRHGEEGREGESQVESQALRLRGSKPGMSWRVEKWNALAADRRDGATWRERQELQLSLDGLAGEG